jgi:hypothetical protein
MLRDAKSGQGRASRPDPRAALAGLTELSPNPEIDRLKRRAAELRDGLRFLSEREPWQLFDPRERERLAAKLAHVEDRIFRLRQMRLFDGR